ncbi:TPA: hypothetical protein EYP37_06085 [Candidatus Poribacteria bacterium]|nr:hypothetical protein [Candidatus Poribacteria bacterium]
MMIESPIYDLIKSEGYAEGVKETLRVRFHDVPQIIQEGIKRLRMLHRHAVLCSSLDEFVRALDGAG